MGAVVVALAGCDDPPVESGAHELAVTDSAGVRIVENPAEALDRPLPWQVADDPHLVLGSVDGEGPTNFTHLMGAFRLSDGRLVVLGGGDPVLALFDADGDFLRGMGGAGDGPGEWNSIGSIHREAGDTIVAHDPMGRALHRYDPEGEPAGSVRLDAPSRVTPLLATHFDGAGRLMIEGVQMDAVAAQEISGRHWITYDPATGAPGPVVEVSGPSMSFAQGADAEFRALRIVEPSRGGWSGLPAAAAGGGRFVTGEGEALTFREWDRQGGLVAEFRVEVPREPDEEVTPAFRALHLDETGHLWVRAPGAGNHWWVVDPEGAVLGGVTLPVAGELLAVSEDEILLRVVDEFDVPHLHLHHLDRERS